MESFSHHQAYGRQTLDTQRREIQISPILRKATAVGEPSNGSFHNPPLRQHLETRCSVKSLHDFDLQVLDDRPERGPEQRPLITTIGVELAQERRKPKQRRNDHPEVTLSLWGGRNGMPCRSSCAMPAVTLNLWGGRNRYRPPRRAWQPGVTLICGVAATLSAPKLGAVSGQPPNSRKPPRLRGGHTRTAKGPSSCSAGAAVAPEAASATGCISPRNCRTSLWRVGVRAVYCSKSRMVSGVRSESTSAPGLAVAFMAGMRAAKDRNPSKNQPIG